jgi:hypothetical protein
MSAEQSEKPELKELATNDEVEKIKEYFSSVQSEELTTFHPKYISSFLSGTQERKREIVSDAILTKLQTELDNAYTNDELIELQHDFSERHHLWLRRNVPLGMLDMGAYRRHPLYSPYSGIIDNLATKIDELNPSFNLNPKISKDEEVNGYKLYDCTGCIMCFSDFCKYKKMFEVVPTPETEMSFEDFYEDFSDRACTEWSKMDDNRESYVGHWQADHDSEEYKNAWYLTRKDNAKALYGLPYSKDFLLETVDIGCSSRLESVRYSNFICVWMARKLELMSGYKTVIIVNKEFLQKAWKEHVDHFLRDDESSLDT